MRQFKAIFLAVALTVSVPLAGCETLGNIYVAATTATPEQATTIYQGDLIYQSLGHFVVAFLQSGKATPAQALMIKNLNHDIYGALEEARAADKAGNSALAAAALKVFNSGVTAIKGIAK